MLVVGKNFISFIEGHIYLDNDFESESITCIKLCPLTQDLLLHFLKIRGSLVSMVIKKRNHISGPSYLAFHSKIRGSLATFSNIIFTPIILAPKCHYVLQYKIHYFLNSPILSLSFSLCFVRAGHISV